MGAIYKKKVEFHPRGGKGALRQAYVALLLRLCDDILEEEDRPLPAVILLRIDDLPASDYVQLDMVCFESAPELQHIHKFLGIKEE